MMKLIILVAPLLLLTPTTLQARHVEYTSQYVTGYSHGVSAAKYDGLGDFMIKQGFGNHTDQFNQGFIDGYCSLPENKGQYTGSDADQGTFNCHDDATTFQPNNSTTANVSQPKIK